MSDTPQIFWSIKEIKEIEFFVDEFSKLESTLDYNYNVDLRPASAEDAVRMTITATYMKTGTSDILMKGKIMTVFLIRDLKSMARINENGTEEVDLPEPLWIALFSIAFTHARAILARSSAGTKYSHMILPPINPQTEFKKLFGPFLKKGRFV